MRPLRSAFQSGVVCLVLQYYYNPHSQQYMYWDGEKHTYIPAAAGQSNTEGAHTSDGAAPSDSPFSTPGSKEKKDKPKNKTAQQVLYILDTSVSTDRCAQKIE